MPLALVLSAVLSKTGRLWALERRVDANCMARRKDEIEVPCAPLFLPEFKLRSPAPWRND